jgi:hypothetical protein
MWAGHVWGIEPHNNGSILKSAPMHRIPEELRNDVSIISFSIAFLANSNAIPALFADSFS